MRKCHLCKLLYSGKTKQHFVECHTNSNGDFMCKKTSQCSQKNYGKNYVEFCKHARFIHRKKLNLKCRKCCRVFMYRNLLVYHESTHDSQGRFGICTLCKLEYTKRSFTLHADACHKDSSGFYICSRNTTPTCARKFSNVMSFLRHIRLCREPIVSTRKDSKSRPDAAADLACRLCNVSYSRGKFRAHAMSCHKDESGFYVCNYVIASTPLQNCSTKYKMMGEFLTHIRWHLRKKQEVETVTSTSSSIDESSTDSEMKEQTSKISSGRNVPIEMSKVRSDCFKDYAPHVNWKCRLCHFKASEHCKTFKAHVEACHKNAQGLFTCKGATVASSRCRLDYRSNCYDAFTSHLLRYHDDVRPPRVYWMCRLCSVESSDRSKTLKKHMDTYHSDSKGVYVCGGKSYHCRNYQPENFTKFYKHVYKVHTNLDMHCGKAVLKQDLQDEKADVVIDNVPGNVASLRRPAAIRSGLPRMKGHAVFRCQHCQMLFSNEKSVSDHLVEKHDGSLIDDLFKLQIVIPILRQTWLCSLCCAIFVNGRNLKRHIMSSHDQNPTSVLNLDIKTESIENESLQTTAFE